MKAFVAKSTLLPFATALEGSRSRMSINKAKLTETDIITKFIMPAIKNSGWDDMSQIRQEVKLRDGKVIVRGQLGVRKTVKSADIVLYHKPSMSLAVIEAKANKHEVGKGMQQGLDYARLLEVPFVFASNGDGFIFHDKTKLGTPEENQLESEIRLEDFPSPQELWAKYCVWKGYTQTQLPIINQEYHDDGTGKHPRYYQLQAINKTIEAISSGKDRVWRPVRVKPTPHFKSSGVYGSLAPRSASCF
jgi:type I restriction enzyme R subunit